MSGAKTELAVLESESIFILRQALVSGRLSTLLCSGGKDSLVLVHLLAKAFFPFQAPCSLLHVDTGFNFSEVETILDGLTERYGFAVERAHVLQLVPEARDTLYRNALQGQALRQFIAQKGYQVVVGGARRDEERARAKERVFSRRSSAGGWNPHEQRPEPWNIFVPHLPSGEHFRVFPLSNWTELDIWAYIEQEQIELPSLYYAHSRLCCLKNGILTAWDKDFVQDEKPERLEVRCRTVGDRSCTGMMKSNARTAREVIQELMLSSLSERSLRVDDLVQEYSLERRKREGYF